MPKKIQYHLFIGGEVRLDNCIESKGPLLNGCYLQIDSATYDQLDRLLEVIEEGSPGPGLNRTNLREFFDKQEDIQDMTVWSGKKNAELFFNSDTANGSDESEPLTTEEYGSPPNFK